jgi:ADP-ribose pyrophosphatase YjhB (NUDIX family)
MTADGAPPRRQRVGAYAVVGRGQDILLTRLAPHIRDNCWSLPGGGIDHGEPPREALRREVYEEAGLHVVPGRLLDVYSTHFTGARPDGLVEDFHGLGLIFEAEPDEDSADVTPHVVEVDGSTAEAAWVPIEEAAGLTLSGVASHAFALLRLGSPS